jgi:hypothetical protein
VIILPIEGESPEEFRARYDAISERLGYPAVDSRSWPSPDSQAYEDWLDDGDDEDDEEGRSSEGDAEKRGDDGCGRQENGEFGDNNTCQKDEGSGPQDVSLKIPPPPEPPPKGFQRPPREERAASLATARLIGGQESLGLPRSRGSVPELAMATALTNRAISANGGHPVVVDKPFSEDDLEALSDALAEDTHAAYEVMGQHEGWYSKDVGDAIEIARSMPGNERIGDGVDKFVFDLGLGLLSAQNSVPDNARYADGFYRHWVDTGSLVVPKEYSAALGRGANVNQFAFVQRLVDEHGWDDVMNFFSGVDTVGNIAKGSIGQTILAPGLSRKERAKVFKVSKEHVDRVLPRLSIFGPKVGPFTHAIHSRDFNYMVSDRWAMRQFGTLTGTLVHATDPDKTRANCQKMIDTLSGIRSGSPLLFGMRKSEVASSLRRARDAGYIDDQSPAMTFLKATVASYAKSKNATGGGYGDKTEINLAANNAFKNKVTMELAPGTGTVSKNVGRLFERARQKVGARDVLEVQALGWGYTQKLWQSMGYRLKRSPESNTFSEAMRELRDGVSELPRIRSLAEEVERQKNASKSKKSKRSHESRSEGAVGEWGDDNDLNSIGRDLQMVFDEQFSSEDAFESYFSYVSGLISEFKKGGRGESRSCDKADGGRFGPGNDCAASDGSSAAATQDSPRPRVDSSWKTDATATHWTESDLKQSPPARSLSKVNSVAMVDPELVADSLKEVGVTLDQAAKVLAPVSNPEASIQIVHGNLAEAAEFLADPEADRVPMPTVTFSSSVPVSGIANAVQTAASLTRVDDGSLIMSYSMFNVSQEAQQKAKFAVGREMMKGVIDSIAKSDKLGVSEIMMSAAGSDADSQFKGYRIWPRLGFDGVIDRKAVTPTWSIGRGFFEPYGSKIPDSILSPRAKKEKSSGKLTVQALYETPEGQSWWEQNGSEMFMSLSPGSDTPGWKKFSEMRGKFGKRSLELWDAFGESVECRRLLDEIWEEFRFDPNQPRDNDGKFASTPGGGSPGGQPTVLSGKATEQWGKNFETEIWTPGKPLFPGAENIPSIRIERPSEVRGIAEEELKMPISEIVSAGGPVIDAAKRAGITLPRMEIRRDSFGGLNVSWTAKGVATGRGFADDEKEYAKVGQPVSAVEANRTVQRTRSGITMSMNGFFIHPDFQGMGLALESHVRSLSVPSERVKMTAERYDSPDPLSRMTGYKAWPKYGYNAPMSRISTRIKVPKEFESARTLLDVYRMPGGREWWAEVGHSIDLEFDRRPRSDSIETLLKLQEAIRSKRHSRSVDMTDKRDRVGCDCDIDELVDEVWDKIIAEGPSGKTGNSPTQEDWDRWAAEDKELRAKDGKDTGRD